MSREFTSIDSVHLTLTEHLKLSAEKVNANFTNLALIHFVFVSFFQLLVFELEKCKVPEVPFSLEPKIKGETVDVE